MLATRLFDLSLNACGIPGPHITGSPNVLVNGIPVCTLGSQGLYPLTVKSACLTPGNFTIMTGSAKILVNGQPIARLFDFDTDGGFVITGSPNVIVR